MENGVLHAERELVKVGEPAQTARFVNRYEPDQTENTEVSGTKTWNHGNNPNPPDSIIVYIYADGELAAQRLVTAEDDWRYSFDLPRYAEDGHEIVYTVKEQPVPGYETEIHGYDLVNTYTGTPEPPDPGDDDKPTPPSPDNPDDPKTGDSNNPALWFALMLSSLAALIVTLLLRRRETRKMRHLKRW